MSACRNAIINELEDRDFGLLKDKLEFVTLAPGAVLQDGDAIPSHVYFLEQGLAPVMTAFDVPLQSAIAFIGRDGMTGISIVMGADAPDAVRIQMHTGGSAWRTPASSLHHCIAQSPTLHRTLLRYAHAYLVQVSETARINAHNVIEERLARWLLLAQDRVGDCVPFTHGSLATLMGVHRPAVTLALIALGKRGLIKRGRGHLVIADRSGLEHFARRAFAGGSRITKDGKRRVAVVS